MKHGSRMLSSIRMLTLSSMFSRKRRANIGSRKSMNAVPSLKCQGSNQKSSSTSGTQRIIFLTRIDLNFKVCTTTTFSQTPSTPKNTFTSRPSTQWGANLRSRDTQTQKTRTRESTRPTWSGMLSIFHTCTISEPKRWSSILSIWPPSTTRRTSKGPSLTSWEPRLNLTSWWLIESLRMRTILDSNNCWISLEKQKYFVRLKLDKVTLEINHRFF